MESLEWRCDSANLQAEGGGGVQQNRRQGEGRGGMWQFPCCMVLDAVPVKGISSERGACRPLVQQNDGPKVVKVADDSPHGLVHSAHRLQRVPLLPCQPLRAHSTRPRLRLRSQGSGIQWGGPGPHLPAVGSW